MTCRDWLKINGFEDVVELIDNAIAKMAIRGSKQRRLVGHSFWWHRRKALHLRRYRVSRAACGSNPST
jgi:hypothetical protein